MMSPSRSLVKTIKEIILLFFDRHEHILRKGKKSSLPVFGTGCTASAALTSPLVILSQNHHTDLLIQISKVTFTLAILSGCLLLFISALWAWESLRYNLDSPLNPFYRSENE